ncbi:MAG: ATP-binding protein [Phaeodactylibacter sp.]|nr:ATP-binding protein [Phaeodactylibacter sp.]
MTETHTHQSEEQAAARLQALDATLDSAIASAWGASSPESQLESLALEGGVLCQAFSTLGGQCMAQLEADRRYPEEETFLYYLINYEWAEEAKAFLLLWRDVLFQLQKAAQLAAEGAVTEENLLRLSRESKEVVEQAAEWLKGFVKRATKPGGRWQPSRKARIEAWRRQKNPWPVYQEQLGLLAGQCGTLFRQHREMAAAGAVFRQVRAEVSQLATACQAEVADATEKAEKAVAFFEQEKSEHGEYQLGKVIAHLENLSGQVQPSPHLFDFSNAVEQALEFLPEKMQVAVSISGGNLITQELNLRRRTRQWLESELLPLLYEAWELAENAANGLKASLSNIRNRAIILSAENKEGKKMEIDTRGILQPLEGFRNIASNTEEELSALAGLANRRLQAFFRLSAIYDTDAIFLAVPLQSSISQFRLHRNKWMQRLQQWMARKAGAFQKWQEAAEREERLSVSEKAVRYIQHRKIPSDNSHYAAIFQSQGYIGESFWVGREEELQHIRNIIDNWEKGYRGAVAITGTRFSGKTFFGEIVANRYFPGKAIRLSPDAVVEVQGRKMEAGYDLEKALEFVRKHTLNQRPMAWIDDLELWWSPSIPLNQNLRSLRRYIDDHSNSIFFLMSMGNVLKSHLQKYHEIGRLFLSEINLDYVPASVVYDAVLIRHGATHINLLDENGEEVAPPAFKRLSDRIHRISGGNIGEALFQWAVSARKGEAEGSVLVEPRGNYSMPDFLGPDSAVLLCAVMIQKRVNEYRLRKSLGPSFSDKYVNILQRLLSVGLLIRQPDGWLEANPVAVNAIGALLESKNYIKYHQWKQ